MFTRARALIRTVRATTNIIRLLLANRRKVTLKAGFRARVQLNEANEGRVATNTNSNNLLMVKVGTIFRSYRLFQITLLDMSWQVSCAAFFFGLRRRVLFFYFLPSFTATGEAGPPISQQFYGGSCHFVLPS